MRSQLERFASTVTSSMTRRSAGAVTLVIYGWQDSQPGTLAWVFPSLRAALRGVRAMRNALRWLIVKGQCALDGEVDIDDLRRHASVLVERAI